MNTRSEEEGALEDEEDADKMKNRRSEDARLGLGFRDSPTPPEPSVGEEAREPASKQRRENDETSTIRHRRQVEAKE
jgi:hypothetical protein